MTDGLATEPRGSTRSRPTIHTIAKAAGVSIATVSYVLNRRDKSDKKIKITDATRERVIKTAADLGYWPNQNARGMRRGRTDQICLVLSHLATPWTQAMIEAVTSACHDIGKTSLLLLDGDWQGFLSRQGADGAVIQGGNLSAADEERLELLAERGVVLVLLNADVTPNGFDTVRERSGPALEEAMDLLTARHQRIACLRRNLGGRGRAERYQAYCEGLERAGIALDPALVRNVFASRDTAYREALDLLQGPNRPTAIFATTDLAAISALWAAHRLGIDVPGDLEIIGVGNSPEGAMTDPPLSSAGAESVFGEVASLFTSRLAEPYVAGDREHFCDWSLYRRGTTR